LSDTRVIWRNFATRCTECMFLPALEWANGSFGFPFSLTAIAAVHHFGGHCSTESKSW
jgi:hypothetical protein